MNHSELLMWLGGLWQTLWLVGLSLAIGLTIAIPCGVLLAARCAIWWKLPVMAFSYLFRGTPMLVQLYIFYYGIGLVIGRIPGVRELALWPLMRQAWPWVMLSFILNTAAYTAEIVRGAIEATPRGEIEAAKALGITAIDASTDALTLTFGKHTSVEPADIILLMQSNKNYRMAGADKLRVTAVMEDVETRVKTVRAVLKKLDGKAA